MTFEELKKDVKRSLDRWDGDDYFLIVNIHQAIESILEYLEQQVDDGA